MRKTLFALLLFVGCSADDEVDDDEQIDYLTFGLSTTIQRTRSEVAQSYLDVDDFGVFAFSSDGDSPFLTNEIVVRELREWSYTNLLNWTDYCGEQSYFYAYSPYATSQNGLSVAAATSDYLQLDYCAPSFGENHPYIMVSYPIVKSAGDSTSYLCFTMQHPLSVVSFWSQEAIESLSLEGVCVESSLRMEVDGLYEWCNSSSSDGVVELTLGDSAMMPPQVLCLDSAVKVVYGDGTVKYFSLGGEVWENEQRVDYTIAADSLYITTLHRELNL